jgi:bisphosphoglycerate-independent phosphoglycerate mutase (AlkP superfamily)
MVPAGVISDIAPTVLEFLGLEKPKDMTSVSLLEPIMKQLV